MQHEWHEGKQNIRIEKENNVKEINKMIRKH